MKMYLKKALKLSWIALILSSSFVYAGDLPRSTSPENAKVYIISPADGESVNETLTIKYGLQGMGVAPAGVDKENTGHHHLLIDGETLPAFDKPMGNDVKHFGGGQAEATIQLSKGKHTLQLILGNHMHVPHDPAVVSEKITVFVQ
jgi:hypothetical protein